MHRRDKTVTAQPVTTKTPTPKKGEEKKPTLSAMDYQQGFTSGSSL